MQRGMGKELDNPRHDMFAEHLSLGDFVTFYDREECKYIEGLVNKPITGSTLINPIISDHDEEPYVSARICLAKSPSILKPDKVPEEFSELITNYKHDMIKDEWPRW